LPHTLTIDMGVSNQVSGLSYLPRSDHKNGRVGAYAIHASSDGTIWSAVASGTWADNADEKTAAFTPTTARYVRLTASTEAGNRGPWTSAAEINLLGVQPKPESASGPLPRDGWLASASDQ
jgi:galactose oxidase